VIIGYLAPSVKEKKDVHSMDVILALLGEGRSSRLYQQLKEERNLVNSVDVDFLTQRNVGTFTVRVSLKKENLKEVKNLILKNLKRLKTEKVKEEELTKAKNLVESMVAFDAETTAGKASYLGFYEAIDDYFFALTYLDEIQKVTADDIQKTAQKYFLDDRYFLVQVIPE
jgi:predicted Zn-dependent peptidase